ncbi:type IV secretion system protein VirB10 [Advenella incenata]|uniref:Type IV secretion system protein VirB10 n=1 Tax=Advenella incenata TaxID=267800 RepID=A0A4Q7V6L9_9BURK|nr:type IV secretion system protein VirB10 [Advenella incenata]RZT91060.1 type IV secretion system protein VirB10 [Advenella incenata]
MNQDDKDREFTLGDGSNSIEPDQPSMQQKVGDEEVERGLPENLTTKKKTNVTKVAIFGAMVLALALLVLAFMSLSGRGKPEAAAPKELDMIKNSRPKNFALEQAELAPPPPRPTPSMVTPSGAPVPEMPTGATRQPQSVSPAMAQSKQEKPVDRRLTGDVLLNVAGGKSAEAGTSGTGAAVSRTESSSANGFAAKLRPTTTEPTIAMKRADLTYLLKKGTGIACTLNTMIVTTQPGITRCMVTKDVYSANGRVLLIERGSEIIGEQTAALVQGQARVYVLWSTIETPAGVSVTINSPSADALGASGQEAQVDNHFWQRFGGAIMLSLIKDAIKFADNQNRNSGGVTFDSSSDSAEDMATEALKNSINIPPTGYVNQGTLVNVMVARDVDFRDVYELVQPYFYSSSTK